MEAVKRAASGIATTMPPAHSMAKVTLDVSKLYLLVTFIH